MATKMDLRGLSAIAVILAAGAGSCEAMARFNSPASIEKIERIASIKVDKFIDHMDIKYPAIYANGHRYRVLESRWEDGSAFRVSDQSKVILHFGDASPYWSYKSDAGVRIYFVDEPRDPSSTGRYDGLDYEYLFVDIDPQGRPIASDCRYVAEETDSRVVRAAMRREVDTKRLNPVPRLIAQALSRDQHDRTKDRCRPHKEP